MTKEEIELLEADAFNPVYVQFIGIAGCQKMLCELLFPSPDKRPMGLDFWLGEK